MGSPACSPAGGAGNLAVPAGGRRPRKGRRRRGPARVVRPPRGASAPGSIAQLSAGSPRGPRARRRQELGRDPERPTRSRPRLVTESARQAGPRAGRTATERSGFGRRRQTRVGNGRRTTGRRRQRQPSRREGGVLVRSRPRHHREEASRGGETDRERALHDAARKGWAAGSGDRLNLRWPQAQRRGRTPPGSRTRSRTTGDTPPAAHGRTSLAKPGGRALPFFRAAADWTGAGPLSDSLLSADPARAPEVASAGPELCACALAAQWSPRRPPSPALWAKGGVPR